MNLRAFLLVIIIASPCLADVKRPQVPWAVDVAVAPRPFDVQPAQAALGLKVLAGPVSSAKAGIAEPLKTDSAGAAPSAAPLPAGDVAAKIGVTEASKAESARASFSASPLPAAAAAVKVGTVKALTPNSVDEAAFAHMVLSCDDDAATRDLLTGLGLTLRDAGPARPLPAFLTAVDCDGADALKAVMPGAVIQAVRYVGEAGPSIAYVAAHADQQFVIVVDIDHLSGSALKTLDSANIVAVIVGHFQAFDARPEEYPTRAEDVKRTVRAIRLVSDAPVLLAVSAVNGFTRRTEKGWTDAFGDTLDSFDGWAVYNLHQWPAILESPSNPRKVVLERLGLPERSCVLLDFLGTPTEYPVEGAKYVTAVWKAKAGLLMKALKDQSWRGVIVYATHSADAEIKAAALLGQ